MAQPYDLSGFVPLRTAVDQMVADQAAGRVKFAGGSITWIDPQTGRFKAVLSVGASPSITTTGNVRAALETLRTGFDLLAGTAGISATNAALAASSPGPMLAAGSRRAVGPVVDGGGAVAQTGYDLSGLATLQVAARQMISDEAQGVTDFSGGDQTWLPIPRGTFLAVLAPGCAAQPTTMTAVRALLSDIRARFDLLDL